MAVIGNAAAARLVMSPTKVAAVATRRAGVFEETKASLRAAGFERVIHCSGRALLTGPDVFWALDLRVEGAMGIVRALVKDGRTRGMVITAGPNLTDVRELVDLGVPSLLVLASIEVAEPSASVAGGMDFSRREIEVLQAMAEGLDPVDAAARLHIAPRTIKSHLARVARRLDTGNTAHSVLLAMRAGLVR